MASHIWCYFSYIFNFSLPDLSDIFQFQSLGIESEGEDSTVDSQSGSAEKAADAGKPAQPVAKKRGRHPKREAEPKDKKAAEEPKVKVEDDAKDEPKKGADDGIGVEKEADRPKSRGDLEQLKSPELPLPSPVKRIDQPDASAAKPAAGLDPDIPSEENPKTVEEGTQKKENDEGTLSPKFEDRVLEESVAEQPAASRIDPPVAISPPPAEVKTEPTTPAADQRPPTPQKSDDGDSTATLSADEENPAPPSPKQREKPRSPASHFMGTAATKRAMSNRSGTADIPDLVDSSEPLLPSPSTSTGTTHASASQVPSLVLPKSSSEPKFEQKFPAPQNTHQPQMRPSISAGTSGLRPGGLATLKPPAADVPSAPMQAGRIRPSASPSSLSLPGRSPVASPGLARSRDPQVSPASLTLPRYSPGMKAEAHQGPTVVKSEPVTFSHLVPGSRHTAPDPPVASRHSPSVGSITKGTPLKPHPIDSRSGTPGTGSAFGTPVSSTSGLASRVIPVPSPSQSGTAVSTPSASPSMPHPYQISSYATPGPSGMHPSMHSPSGVQMPQQSVSVPPSDKPGFR